MKTKSATLDYNQKRGQWRDVFSRFIHNPLAVIGGAFVLAVLLSAVFADVLMPYDYATQNLGERFAALSWAHPCGTDNYGRDILCRILYGGRISLVVSLLAVFMATLTGAILGMLAGFYRSWVDTAIMRVIDILMAIPQFLLAVCLSATLGTGLFNTAIAIAIGGIPGTCRIMRATVMSIRGEEYIEAARARGSNNVRIMWFHIFPNALAPIIVEGTLRIGASIITIAGLSFVGLGVQPPIPEWGSMLNAGRPFIRDYAPLILFPGIAIMATLIGFNLLGDGLRDALDPKMKD